MNIRTRCSRCRKSIPYGESKCDKCEKTVREIYRKNSNNTTDHLLKSSTWKSIRLFVIRRDKGCCRLCFINKRISTNRLEVHHIIKRSVDASLVYEPTNLVTVCKSCHEVLERLSSVEQQKMLGNLEVTENRYL